MERFQILCLSGGGFRGLFTARVLEAIEQKAGRPLYQCFDLIAGTSIGGILALGLAAGKSAAEIAAEFEDNGSKIFPSNGPKGALRTLASISCHLRMSLYDPKPLRDVIERIVGTDLKIGHLKTRVIIPAVNLSKGKPQVFKTPHDQRFERDYKLRAVDVALATSAAPTFFRPHRIGAEAFADGGLYANSPDELALHEACHFLERSVDQVSLLSVGTTTSNFAWSKAELGSSGYLTWSQSSRLMSATIGSQQLNADYIMGHRLADRYFRLDAVPSHAQSAQLGLDVATDHAISDLNALAEGVIRDSLGSSKLAPFLSHCRPEPKFFCEV